MLSRRFFILLVTISIPFLPKEFWAKSAISIGYIFAFGSLEFYVYWSRWNRIYRIIDCIKDRDDTGKTPGMVVDNPEYIINEKSIRNDLYEKFDKKDVDEFVDCMKGLSKNDRREKILKDR